MHAVQKISPKISYIFRSIFITEQYRWFLIATTDYPKDIPGKSVLDPVHTVIFLHGQTTGTTTNEKHHADHFSGKRDGPSPCEETET